MQKLLFDRYLGSNTMKQYDKEGVLYANRFFAL
jgi:hypothetical protein